MSVFQRNGHWYLYVVVNGKKIRKAIREARTRRQAERAERVLRDEIFENRYGEGGQKLLSDFVEKSYKPYSKEHKRGYRVELSALKVLIEKFGKLKLCEITPEAVEKFKRERASEKTRRGKTRAKSTVNRDIAVLSSVFNLAKSFGEIKNNPVSNVKYYTNLNSRESILSDAEEIILLTRIENDVIFFRQVKLLLYTGMRRGELFLIEWRDIDLTDGFINLRKEFTKTGKARVVPMLSNVKEIFETLYREAGNLDGTEKVFSGGEAGKHKLTTKFRKVRVELKLSEDLTPHSLRHTWITRAEEEGVRMFTIKAIVGHSQPTMTDRYTHLSKEALKTSLEPLEQRLSRTKDTKSEKQAEQTAKPPNLLAFKSH